MKRFFVILTIIISLGVGGIASASYNFEKNSGLKETGESLGYNTNKGGDNFIESYLGQILTIIFSLLGILFFGLTLYAGFLWMTAQGNDSKISEAKKMLVNAIIGLIVILASYAITYFVISTIQKNNSTPAPVASIDLC